MSAAMASGASAPAGSRIAVRETGPADLDAVVALLSERDGRTLDRGAVFRNLCGLEPALIRGWMATVDGEPAGLTTLYVNDLRLGDRTARSGYWSHLFVREGRRRLMLYPQLVFAMMKGVRGAGIDVVYTGTRQPHVAEGHLKLGFVQVGAPRVWVRPVRPVRLITKHKGLPSVLSTLGAPLDALWKSQSGALRPRVAAGIQLREVGVGSPEIGAIAALLESKCEGRIARVWTGESLARRLAGAIDGGSYSVLAALRDGAAVGAAISCLTTRGAGIATGVVLDVIAPDGDRTLERALWAEATARLADRGAEAVIALADGGGGPADALSSLGWRRTQETYHMVVWPKDAAKAGSRAADFSNWRFTFLDHDAF